MHAVATEGRLKDVSRDAEREYQLITSGGGSLPAQQLSSSGGDAGGRSENSYDVADVRSSTKETRTLTDDHGASGTSDALMVPAPLQRLERLESELASLNHARRRLAIGDDFEAGSSSWNAVRHGPLSTQSTLFGRRQGDVDQPVAWNRSAAAGGATAGDVVLVCGVKFICIDILSVSLLLRLRSSFCMLNIKIQLTLYF